MLVIIFSEYYNYISVTIHFTYYNLHYQHNYFNIYVTKATYILKLTSLKHYILKLTLLQVNTRFCFCFCFILFYFFFFFLWPFSIFCSIDFLLRCYALFASGVSFLDSSRFFCNAFCNAFDGNGISSFFSLPDHAEQVTGSNLNSFSFSV